MPSFSRATAAMRCIFPAWAISISDGIGDPLCGSGDSPRPRARAALIQVKLLDEQDRNVGDVQNLGRGGADQRLAELAHAAGADVDQLAAPVLGVLDQCFGHWTDENARLVGDAGGVELLLGRLQHPLALFLIVALELRL